LRAMTRKITWYQAAETIGISDRQMRRWGERYQEFGYDRLFDRRRGQPHPHSLAQVSVHRTDANLGHSAEPLRIFNRHRGSGHPLSPATPPYMRVRIRRFSSVELGHVQQPRKTERVEVCNRKCRLQGRAVG
jgi:hypothetical protein